MLYLFDKNEKLIHELASNELESLIQHEELNKLMTLEFGVFIDSNDKMKDIEYIAHKDMEDYQKIQMYRIIGSESDDNTVNYQAVHIIFDELKAYGYIRDKRPEMVKASAALDIALAGSRWKVGKVDDSQLLSTNFYDSTRLDALSKIIKTWNLDLHFYLTFDGNKITGRFVDLLGFRGEDTGERFVYGTNALEVVKEVDKSEVYTRVIPRGKGEEKHDENGKPTDGYGRRIKIDDVVWEKTKGNPIDKPKGQEYLELKEMTNKFGFSDGEPRTRVQIFDNIEDPKELIKAGYDFLVKVSRPLVQFKTKISKRSRTNVGDIVRIIRKDLDFYYRTRIYKAHRNLLNETLEVEFGDKLVQSPADREKIVSDSLSSLEERIKETETDLKSSFVDKINESITHATFNRDGYNYELKKGNKYGLPAGYYSFDREIDDNPQRVIYVGAGTLAIADSKKSNGDWNFRTFGTGEGFVADLLVAGTILGGNVRWNLEDGTFLIGENANDYSMYWDGGTLHFRNVDIDLKNSKDFSQIKDDLDKKISKDDILEDKEIQEALKGKDGKDGIDGQAGKDGKDGHVLTVEVWLDGEFRNYKTKNVKRIIQAKYDGEDIELDSSNTEIYNCYGNGEWNRAALSDFWADWDRSYEYIANKVVVSYKGLKAEAYARLDNIKDGEKGETGKQGIPGKDGIDGKDGRTGKIGQNLLRNSNVPVSNKLYNTKEWTLCETPITGEKMTFTAKVKLEKDDKLMVYNSGGMITLDWWTDVSKSQDYVIYSSTFKWKDTYVYNGKTYEQTNPPTLKLYTQSNGNGENFNNNTVSIEWATLTRGDIPAIEWTPCYADVDDAIKAGKEESEEISRKLIKVESDFKVESNNIKSSVSSLSESTERSFVNLKKDIADADVKVETGIKNYLVNNYSTKVQTDETISQAVGSVLTGVNILGQNIKRMESSIVQTNEKIETKVSKDGFSSLVKQEFDRYKVQAKNIDFEGSYVNVKGTFQTMNDSNDVGVKISYNNIEFRDNRWDGKTFGGLTTGRLLGTEKSIALDLYHYQTGYIGIAYWKNEDKLYHHYVSFDIWNYTGRRKDFPITFFKKTHFRDTVRFEGNVHFDPVRLKPYGDGLAIENYGGHGLYVTNTGEVWIKKGDSLKKRLDN